MQKNLASLKTRMEQVKSQFEYPANTAHRAMPEILPVTKKQSISTIQGLVELGFQTFGENYLQEIEEKSAHFTDSINWHYIGALQSRKIPKIVEHCAMIYTVDKIKHLDLIAKAAAALQKTPFPICINVNIGREPQKRGIMAEELPLYLAEAEKVKEVLYLKGILALPPLSDISQAEQPKSIPTSYQSLRKLADQTPGQFLSLGTSQDLEYAVAAGSNQLRIGTALAGSRAN